MKKVIMYLSILVLVLAFVSCDSEVFNKLTDAMGIMNENVYGLEPNLEAVDEAVEAATSGVEVTVDGEGKTTADELDFPEGSSLAEEVGLDVLPDDFDSEHGVADIDFSDTKADLVHESVAKIVNSPEAKKAFIEELKEPAADTNGEAVSNALKIAKAKIKKMADALEEGETVKVVLNSINNIIIPDLPTKGDLVVMQVLVNLAQTINDNKTALLSGTDAEKLAAQNAILEEAFKTLETLKTIGKASSIDLMGIFSIDALLGGRSTSRASIEDTFSGILEDSVGSLIDQIVILSGIPATDTITTENVSSMVNEFVILRASYESSAYGENPVSWVDGADNAAKLRNYSSLSKTGDSEFELEDIVLYGVAVGITDLYERIGEDDFVKFLNDLVDNKADIQAAFLANTPSDIPQVVLDDFDDIKTTYKNAFTSRSTADLQKAFTVANTLLYLNWESKANIELGEEIEGKLVEIFGDGE